MSKRNVVAGPSNWLVWLGGVICVVVGFGVVVVFGADFTPGIVDEDSPVHIEEFRVAEPFAGGGDPALRDRLETITAVTEPFDEVEAAIEDESQQPASTSGQLERQCTTVLKEMAFCSGEDKFLKIIGEADTLRTGQERELFMERVQDWFEPGGARRYCEGLLRQEEMAGEQKTATWSDNAAASGEVCPEFGEVLMETEILDMLAVFWQS